MISFYHHNLRLPCDCQCHKGGVDCNCGWRIHFPLPYERIKLKATKLNSRIKPFAARPKVNYATNRVYAPNRCGLIKHDKPNA